MAQPWFKKCTVQIMVFHVLLLCNVNNNLLLQDVLREGVGGGVPQEDRHLHPLLDRAPSQRSATVARQGSNTGQNRVKLKHRSYEVRIGLN